MRHLFAVVFLYIEIARFCLIFVFVLYCTAFRFIYGIYIYVYIYVYFENTSKESRHTAASKWCEYFILLHVSFDVPLRFATKAHFHNTNIDGFSEFFFLANTKQGCFFGN